MGCQWYAATMRASWRRCHTAAAVRPPRSWTRSVPRGGLHREHLGEAPAVARLAAERRAEEGHRHSKAGSGPMTRAPSVSTFMSSCSTPWCAEYVSWQTAAPDAAHLVGRHRRADARAADQDAAVRVAVLDRLAKALREVRVVVVGVGAVAAEVDRARGRGRSPASRRMQVVLQSGPGVVGRERDAHGRGYGVPASAVAGVRARLRTTARPRRGDRRMSAEMAAVDGRDPAAQAVARRPAGRRRSRGRR